MNESIILSQNMQKTRPASQKELANYLESLIENEWNEMSDEDKQKMEARIMQKLESGKKLTAEEIDYLRKYNPILYQRYLRIQRMAEAMEEQLKQAKSKEEANDIIGQSMSGISDKDPDKKYMIAAMNEVAKKFKQSSAYGRLPTTKEEAEKRKGRAVRSSSPNEEPDEQEDLLSWSPLQEILDMRPTFVSKA